jgi:hypothetical protein
VTEASQKVPSKMVALDRNEFDGTAEALVFYMNAYMSSGDNGCYGQQAVQKDLQTYGDDSFLWLHIWFGKNHQRIKAGDDVRLWSPKDEPEFTEAEVLDVTTFAAFLLTDNGAEWHPWPLVHRLDRLHTEPDFDATHWVPCSLHMGHDVDPDSLAEYEAGAKKHARALTVVPDEAAKRTDLLVATIDGVRVWALSNGGIEWEVPDHFSTDDLDRLAAWVAACAVAKRSGEEFPAYRDYAREDVEQAPITSDDLLSIGRMGIPVADGGNDNGA